MTEPQQPLIFKITELIKYNNTSHENDIFYLIDVQYGENNKSSLTYTIPCGISHFRHLDEIKELILTEITAARKDKPNFSYKIVRMGQKRIREEFNNSGEYCNYLGSLESVVENTLRDKTNQGT